MTGVSRFAYCFASFLQYTAIRNERSSNYGCQHGGISRSCHAERGGRSNGTDVQPAVGKTAERRKSELSELPHRTGSGSRRNDLRATFGIQAVLRYPDR